MSDENVMQNNDVLEDADLALNDLNRNMSKEPGARPQTGTRPPYSGNRPQGGRPQGGRPQGGPGGRRSFFAKKVCKFSTGQIDPATINYKNIDMLKGFVMPSGKIVPRRITGTSAKYQRLLALEIKKARIMALLPFSAR
ncbi:MAG: 30S ribosomal protein S18 [Brevinema sp.]